MTHNRIKTCAVCASVGLLFTTSALAGPSFMGLDELFGGSTIGQVNGISADGKIIFGTSHLNGNAEAYRWSIAAGTIMLGGLQPQDFESRALASSANGATIVGSSLTINDYDRHYEAFHWTEQDGMTSLGNLYENSYYTTAKGISDDGSTAVGWDSSPQGDEAVIWTKATGIVSLGHLTGGSPHSIALDSSADGAIVVGRSTSINGEEAFRWSEVDGMQGLGDIPGGGYGSTAFSVSADGSTIVGWSLSKNHTEAFRWTESEGMIGLGITPGLDINSVAYGTNADGSIVLGVSYNDFGNEPFLWTQLHGIRTLSEALINDYALDLTGWQLTGTPYISSNGFTIVGGGINPDGHYEPFIARIPTPGALMLFGLGGLTILRCRR